MEMTYSYAWSYSQNEKAEDSTGQNGKSSWIL